MNKPYLVRATLDTNHYLCKPITTLITRIVMAKSEQDAKSKLEQHFDDKCVMHDVNYYLYNIEVHEPIM